MILWFIMLRTITDSHVLNTTATDLSALPQTTLFRWCVSTCWLASVRNITDRVKPPLHNEYKTGSAIQALACSRFERLYVLMKISYLAVRTKIHFIATRRSYLFKCHLEGTCLFL